MGKEVIDRLMDEVPDAILCFTDGSCISNPGPCGAGAVIYVPGQEEVCITRPVAAYGSILLGELVAILSVTEHFMSAESPPSSVRIFCDSQTATGGRNVPGLV